MSENLTKIEDEIWQANQFLLSKIVETSKKWKFEGITRLALAAFSIGENTLKKLMVVA